MGGSTISITITVALNGIKQLGIAYAKTLEQRDPINRTTAYGNGNSTVIIAKIIEKKETISLTVGNSFIDAQRPISTIEYHHLKMFFFVGKP